MLCSLPPRALPAAAARAASACSARVPALGPRRVRAAAPRGDVVLGRGLPSQTRRGVAARAQSPKNDEWQKPDPEGRDVWDSELVGGAFKYAFIALLISAVAVVGNLALPVIQTTLDSFPKPV